MPSHPTVQKEELPGTTSFLRTLGSRLVSWLSPIFARFYVWLEGTRQRPPLPSPLPVFLQPDLAIG